MQDLKEWQVSEWLGHVSSVETLHVSRWMQHYYFCVRSSGGWRVFRFYDDYLKFKKERRKHDGKRD